MEDFDKLVKSLMESGTEEVPASLWESVQSQLPAQKVSRKPVVLLWTRRVGVALAAAAAVTLAVVFAGHQPEAGSQIEIASVGGEMMAEVSEAEIAAASEAPRSNPDAATGSSTRTFVPSSVVPQHIGGISEQPAVEETPAEAQETTETVVSEHETVNTDLPTNNYTDKTEETQSSATSTAADPFAAMEREDAISSRKKVGTALALYGDATSNTKPAGKGATGPFRVSVAVPTATGITETGESSYMIPLSFGAGLKFSFTEHWALGVGVNCTYLSRTYDGIYREFGENSEAISATTYSGIRNNQVYLGIPVNVYYSIVNNRFVDFYVYGGGSLEKCIYNNNIMKAPETGNKYFKDDLGKLMYSAGAGLGCQFNVAKHLGIYIDPSIRYYFNNSTTPKSIRTQQPFMVGFEAGLRIDL